MLFPFVSYRVVLDDSEKNALDELRKPPNSSRKDERALRMAKVFEDSELKVIPAENEQQKENLFNLFTNRPSKTKPEIFKLTSATQSKSLLNNPMNSCQKIELFQPLTMGSHTLFFIG